MLKSRLCNICLDAFSPVAIHRVSDRYKSVCTKCLKTINRDGEILLTDLSQDVAPTAKDTEQISTNLLTTLQKEGVDLIYSVKRFFRLTNLRWLLTTGARSTTYVTIFALATPGATSYPAMQGAILADFTTWFLFSVFKLPFQEVSFAIEFFIYGGLFGGYLIHSGGDVRIPDTAEATAYASFAFLTIAIAKISWWSMKVFVLDED